MLLCGLGLANPGQVGYDGKPGRTWIVWSGWVPGGGVDDGGPGKLTLSAALSDPFYQSAEQRVKPERAASSGRPLRRVPGVTKGASEAEIERTGPAAAPARSTAGRPGRTAPRSAGTTHAAVGHQPADRSERMVVRHPGFRRDVAIHRPLLPVIATHAHLLRKDYAHRSRTVILPQPQKSSFSAAC